MTSGFARRSLPLMLIGAALVAGLDRDGLIPVTRGIRDFLQLPSGQLQGAFNAHRLGFWLTLVAGSFLADWQGPRRMLGFAVAATAAAAGLAACAWNLSVIEASQFLMGLGSGLALPAVLAGLAWAIWPEQRGRGVGLVLAGFALGAGFGLPVAALVQWLGSWRGGFAVFCLVGVAWSLSWRRVAAGVMDRPPVGAVAASWFGRGLAMAVPMALAFVQAWGMGLCRNYLPAVLLQTWHYDVIGETPAILSLGAAVFGNMAGGFATDGIMIGTGNLAVARRAIVAAGLAGALLALLMVHGGDGRGAALWLSFAAFCLYAALVPLWTMALDLDDGHPGWALGFIAIGLAGAQALSPMALVGLTGSLGLAWFTGLVLLIGGVLGAFTLASGPRPRKSVEPDGETALAPAG